jgi:hypothetical protein
MRAESAQNLKGGISRTSTVAGEARTTHRAPRAAMFRTPSPAWSHLNAPAGRPAAAPRRAPEITPARSAVLDGHRAHVWFLTCCLARGCSPC